MFNNFPIWPERASSIAGNVDALFIFLLIVTGLVSLLIFTCLLYFAARYRHKAHKHAEQIEGSTPLELTWSIIPLGVFLVIFAWGAIVFFQERTPPRGATEVYVVAKQWMWKLEHAEGQREINELHVPVGRDVKLIMTSQDVIHSFFVPAFRMKQDVLPGRYTTAWFRATKPGTYHLFCAEYCGTRPGPTAARPARSPQPEKKCSPSSVASPATAPTARAAARTCKASSANRFCSKAAALSRPMKTTSASRSSIPVRKL
jgi:cytochrome c oxidase subunit 2